MKTNVPRPKMNIYKVTVRTKNGGYRDGDMVTAGGSYDTYHDYYITASSSKNAIAALKSNSGSFRQTFKAAFLGPA
jgi:hypothetical protein